MNDSWPTGTAPLIRMKWLALILLVGSIGCLRGSTPAALGDPEQAIGELDKAWEAGRYREAKEGLVGLAQPSNAPVVGWRIGRAAVGLAMSTDDTAAARDFLLEGRAAGWSCLNQSPAFDQLRRDEGWSAAANAVTSENARCALWAAVAWVRWLENMGSAGAELDANAIRSLLQQPDVVAADPSLVRWTLAVLEALVAPAIEDIHIEQLKASITDEPNNLVRVADLIFLGLLPAGRSAEVGPIVLALRDLTDLSPESRNAQKRLFHMKEGALFK